MGKVNLRGEERRIVKRYGKNLINVEGVGSMVEFRRGTSPRHRIIGDLKACGMRNAEIADLLNGGESTVGQKAYIGLVSRNNEVQNYVDQQQQAIVGEAKAKLLSKVGVAADNIAAAIDGGDLRCSERILTSFGALTSGIRTEQHEVKVSFGDWLSSHRDSRAIDVTPREGIISSDVDELSSDVEGVRLSTE